MSKYKKVRQPSPETIEEAMNIAKGTQKPGQSKEQTKLIAQGIQKGIAEYKKQQKAKAREQKKLKKKSVQPSAGEYAADIALNNRKCKTQWLPWMLLLLSWFILALFVINQKI